MAVKSENVVSDRMKALETALGQIERQFGKGAIMKMGDRPPMRVNVIPTGSVALDAALGVGGFPRGRVIEVYGPESSGKTTLALHVIANAQKTGGLAAFIDAEHALDPEYAAKLGVNLDELLVSQPDFGEQALEIAETLIRSGSIDVIVIDSVAALVPRAELEGDMGEAQMGLQARLMSQALRKLAGIIAKSNTCLVFINQIREKIGVMFGSPETTTGGRALKFYSSVRVDIRRISAIKQGEDIIGNRTRARSPRTRWPRPSARRSSTFSMVRAFPLLENCWTSGWSIDWSRSPARGTRVVRPVSVRAGKPPGPFSRRIPRWLRIWRCRSGSSWD